MKNFLILFLFLSISISPQVKTGLDVLVENNFKPLHGKKVGLITNATGVDFNLVQNIDLMHNHPSFKLTALYGPEHGVRGDYSAGDHVDTYTDEKTGLTVYSLYGKTRKPNPDMLANIDVLVFDIQDIGSRSYTYISTMGLAMEAAAEAGIEFVVLDRPNPLGGEKIEGSLVEPGFISFVSQFPIPYVHGLTVGELAMLLNGEKMLKEGKQCELSVVKMEGWERRMDFNQTGLRWVPTSPHIPTEHHAKYYTATGILGELGIISEGVGYTLPFQVMGYEGIKADKIAGDLTEMYDGKIVFRPIFYKPYYGKYIGKKLNGVQIHFVDYRSVDLMSIQFNFLTVLKKYHPEIDVFTLADKSRITMLSKVLGSDKIAEIFRQNYNYNEVKKYFASQEKSFRDIAQKYFLYN
ncbi:MAG: DUF1343 domain-containing protein [Ignavibacteriaceae bacterium]|nr:DUF1343 domain-containing protein [Ignavibacteriaceae bacterium]